MQAFSLIIIKERIGFSDALIKVCNSWIANRLDDYNSSMFFENPEYIHQSDLIGSYCPDNNKYRKFFSWRHKTHDGETIHIFWGIP